VLKSYQYSCGGWLKGVTLPADKTSISRSFSNISDENLILLREILEDGWPLISDFYTNCMDNATRDKLGAAPLQDYVKIIDDSTSSVIQKIAQLHILEIRALFSFGLGTDLDDPTFGLAEVDQGGIGLPRDYYFNTGAAFVSLNRLYA
jgi:putative endopeptidase